MKRRIFYALAGLAAVSAGFALWSRTGRRPPTDPIDLHLVEAQSLGADHGAGNLVGIQPYMLASDYASEERFHRKIDGYLAAARAKGYFGKKTIVVLPEHLGTWLVVAGEKRAVYGAKSIDRAAKVMIASNLVRFLRWGGRTNASGARRTLFNMKGEEMADIYQRVFSSLARTYYLTIVAGSIVLPQPVPGVDGMQSGTGRIVNVSPIYGPEGQLSGIVEKQFLTDDEKPFLDTSGGVYGSPVFDTPAGRLGVLVCADSWYPAAYAGLKKGQAEIVVVPSFLSTGARNAWDRTWFGYQGEAPSDVDRRDVQRLTEGEAWAKHGLPGRIRASSARAGMTVFLRGRLWDLTSDGPACAVVDGKLYQAPRVDGATLERMAVNKEHGIGECKGEGRSRAVRDRRAGPKEARGHHD